MASTVFPSAMALRSTLGGDGSGVVLRQRRGHQLGGVGGDDGDGAGGRSHGYQAGAGAQSGQAGHGGGARLAARTGHHQHVAEGSLVARREARRQQVAEHGGLDQRQPDGSSSSNSSGGLPMGRTTSSPTESQLGGSACAILGAVKVTVESARAHSPAGSPESLGMPEGISTATTLASGKPALISRMPSSMRPAAGPEMPVPSSASTTRVA